MARVTGLWGRKGLFIAKLKPGIVNTIAGIEGMPLTSRDGALDFFTLPPLILAHCVAVLVLLCMYTAGWMAAFDLLHIDGGHTTLLLLGFVVPVVLAGMASWFSYKFIFDRVARTTAGRELSGAAITFFAATPPFYMLFVLIFVGCAVQKWIEGRCVML
jgi:hypothetical protein